MGLRAPAFISRLLSFSRVTADNGAKLSEAKIDTGGGANVTGEHFATPGSDSHPLPNDTLLAVHVRRSGGLVVVGYIDTENEGKAGPGEWRAYARNSDGEPVVEVWLKSDGSAVVDNGAGAIELKPNGDIDLNGAIIDSAGLLTVTDAAIAGVLFSTHVHTSAAPGSPTGPPASPPPPP